MTNNIIYFNIFSNDKVSCSSYSDLNFSFWKSTDSSKEKNSDEKNSKETDSDS
jgi:hypothetical protein